MIFNIVFGALIFGYAGWAVFRHIKKSKQGKCAACSLAKNCETKCDSVS
ncbi:FeoB-associated Cys-rich membrane protein [Fictibacillus sp. 7GRE50]|uniref:Hydrolase n=1 Tax=Fictibacillus phosphorivorans TaxID=1221500 RepID=A0A160IMN2_9BACL|nr:MULTISPECIES: FeoB-associated Cys-rich membrane protein [Fictibacillus]ANC77543.1 hydrolase [Fictibacillus phosphorivorans]MBH0166741.1 FeoB-associated Cys-rich membrane protein [Fictibacillus sp. 7GRE50]MQR94379.1 FeoB-associated Cys-rich membrane protein [Fictibacillus phosphorivorans]